MDSYASSAGDPPPPPGPPPPPAIAVNPQPRLDEVARQMQQQFNERERSLHEEMAATRQSARQVIDQQAGEIEKAAAASTDEVRKRREAEDFARRLAAELRTTKDNAQEVWTELMQRQVANAQREKEKLDSATASSSGLNRSVPKASSPVYPTNPIIRAPSLQPSGVAVPGKERAVQPTTGSNIPANPAPATNSKAREDDKPLNKTVREGGSEPIQRKAQKQVKETEKQKREDKRMQISSKQNSKRKQIPHHHLQNLKRSLLKRIRR